MDTTAVGQLLDQRYLIEELVGRGGMGSVYRGLDMKLDRPVAVKILHPETANAPEARAQLAHEARSAARLPHPGIVAVYDRGDIAGRGFLVMEYVPGKTLRSLLADRGRVSPRRAFDVLEPVLTALGAAHAAGIVHRDIKPENILLASDGRIKIADFGLAQSAVATVPYVRNPRTVAGTAAYLAPEQLQRGVADARSDVYAAGVLLFEMLTGQTPHPGGGPHDAARRHLDDETPRPSELVPGLAAELDALTARATHPDPDHRPRHARDLLAEMETTRRSLSDTELDGVGLDGVGLERPRRPIPSSWDQPTTIVAVTSRSIPPQLRRGPQLPQALQPRRFRGAMVFAFVVLIASALCVAAWFTAQGR
jgi:eukaryotic-like serine/threonine-protein kinase